MILDAERFRVRTDAIADDLTRPLAAPGAAAICVLATTTTLKNYPNAAFAYYACLANVVLGAELEGGSASLTPTLSSFFALNVGNSTPPNGTAVIANYVGNRWVFRYDG